MKNFRKISLLLILPLLCVMISCDDDSNFDGEEPTFGWVEFDGASTSVAVNSSTEGITIPVNFTAPINKQDLLIDYTILNVEDNASASEVLNSLSGTLVIEADTNTDAIFLTLDEDAAVVVAQNEAISFDVRLTSVDRDGVPIGIDDASVIVHRVNLVCDITLDIGGMYSVTTTYGYHDFLPSFNPNTEDTEIRDNGDGTFFVQDMSGGLYNGGPYTTAYGTGPNSFDLTFFNVCKSFNWTGQSDGYGACIPLEGGVNEIDLDTGVITLSWFCEGYGENGVSVYTPL